MKVVVNCDEPSWYCSYESYPWYGHKMAGFQISDHLVLVHLDTLCYWHFVLYGELYWIFPVAILSFLWDDLMRRPLHPPYTTIPQDMVWCIKKMVYTYRQTINFACENCIRVQIMSHRTRICERLAHIKFFFRMYHGRYSMMLINQIKLVIGRERDRGREINEKRTRKGWKCEDI